MHCFERVFPTFVKWKNFQWIVGTIIAVVGAGLIYTNTVAQEHDVLAQKKDVQKLSEIVNDIENKQVQVMTNQKNIIESVHELDQKLDKILEKLK